jgi:predicted enzyme related to lactoylglutathione lyase
MTEAEKISMSISVDVPNLDDAIGFYTSAFGFTKSSAPAPGVAVLRGGNMNLCLLEKQTGTRASPHTDETRHYERHWTPVHLDIHVDNLEAALARALDAGAVKEQMFANPKHGSAAFCSDPFGHGFCLIQMNREKAS